MGVLDRPVKSLGLDVVTWYMSFFGWAESIPIVHDMPIQGCSTKLCNSMASLVCIEYLIVLRY